MGAGGLLWPGALGLASSCHGPEQEVSSCRLWSITELKGVIHIVKKIAGLGQGMVHVERWQARFQPP